MRSMESYRFLVVGVLAIGLFSSSVIVMLPAAVSNQQQPQSAFATFPGENGKIAFRKAVGDWDKGDIYVMNADGSGQIRLTNDPGYRLYPDWSPDGEKIAYARGTLSNNDYQIYVMNADGSERTKISNGPDSDQYPSWSPDGTKIAFASGRDYNYDIYVMNADGSERTRLTTNPGNDVDPNWSPDGKKIAYARTIDGGVNYDIYVMNADGSGQIRLTTYGDDDLHPDWSPDGTKIAFTSDTDASGHFDIYVMNADGSERTNLSNDGLSMEPSWSPDGTKIAFSNGIDIPGSPDIFVMTADGSERTRLTTEQCCVVNDQPDWGPATDTGPEDDTPPALRVPDDITAQATTANGGTVVTYSVTVEDDLDGTAILEEDGSLTQDDVGGDITISCEPASGTEFPVGDTIVECTATDAAGNVGGPTSFTVTVLPPEPEPPSDPAQATEELISDVQNLEGVSQGTKTSLTAPLRGVVNILNDDNPNNDSSACGRFGAFINQVNAAERRGTLTEDQAADLRTQAEDIRDMLGC